MGVPGFLLRKLYKRGSLREVSDGRFAFSLQNPLSTATITSAPQVVVNGVHVPLSGIHAEGLVLEGITEDEPLIFKRGDQFELNCPGRLLRGGNRIHVAAETKEWGEIEFLVEDKAAEFCDLPSREEE